MTDYGRRCVFAVVILLVCCRLCGCASTLLPRVQDAIPNTSRAMDAGDFWTSRLGDPDKVILTPAQIELFNAHTRDVLKLNCDVTAIGPVYPAAELRSALAADLAKLRAEKLFLDDGTVADEAFYRPFESLPVSDTKSVTYGIVTRFADQRILPTDKGLYAKPGDRAFDELQNSGLDIGTPLAVLFATGDGVWLYARSPLTAGWVKAADVATCSVDALRRYLRLRGAGDSAVITAARAEIFRDAALTIRYGTVRMGAGFPLVKELPGDLVTVTLPERAADGVVEWVDGFLHSDAIHRGYLPYTARTIIEQAFKLMGAPYGWGDRGGEQDCSRFIQEVFAAVGIEMPRNSSGQDKVGVSVQSLPAADPGVTILKLPGHIMLYLGLVDGRPYVIHALYGYRERTPHGDRLRVINRVAVSDLSLGEGSAKGSLLERITTIRKVVLP